MILCLISVPAEEACVPHPPPPGRKLLDPHNQRGCLLYLADKKIHITMCFLLAGGSVGGDEETFTPR